MRHIVTGGCGFIGEHLVHRLAAMGEPVLVFDWVAPLRELPPQVTLLRGDIRERSDLVRLALRPDDIVYHLAARQFHAGVPQFGRDRWFAEVNTSGTSLILETMEENGADRLIFFSTDMVYGLPNRTPVPTNHPLRPLGPYGKSKAGAEVLLSRYLQRGMRISVFRPRLVTGPGRYGILLRLFRLIKAGLPVPMIGDGRNRYQMVSVHDCVDAALKAVDLNFPSGPFNLGSTDPPTVRELLEFMVSRAGSRSQVVATPASLVKGLCKLLDLSGIPVLYPEQFQIADRDYILDTGDTARALHWVPKHGDRDMMVAAYEEYLRGLN